MTIRYVLFFDLAWTGYTGWAIYDKMTDTWVKWGAFQPRQKPASAIPDRAVDLEFKHDQLYHQLGLVLQLLERIDVVGYEYTDWHHGAGEAADVGRDRVVLPALAMAELTLVTACRGLPLRALGANYIKSEFGGTSKADVAHLIAAQWPGQFTFEKHKHGFLRAGSKLMRHDITDALAGCYVLARLLNLEEMIEDGT